MSRECEREQQQSALLQAVNRLAESTRIEYSNAKQVRTAFMLGMWCRQFPDYMFLDLQEAFEWDLHDIDPSLKGNWGAFEKFYSHTFKFSFISDTGDSWHQCYQDIRRHGWKRLKVHRKGGDLQYLFELTLAGMPQGYSTAHLLLQISISTCKQVQVGTQMVEQPIFETKCDDLVDLSDEEAEQVPKAAEVIPLVVIDDVEELQQQQQPADDKRPPPFKDEIPF
jgi:hypothetical protein